MEQSISIELNEFIANENEKYEEEEVKNREHFKNTERWYTNVFSVVFPEY